MDGKEAKIRSKDRSKDWCSALGNRGLLEQADCGSLNQGSDTPAVSDRHWRSTALKRETQYLLARALPSKI